MAVYEYRCQDCGNLYDILHLGKENAERIVCPECESRNYKKLLSVFNSASRSSSSNTEAAVPSCPSGACGIGGGCFN